MPDIHLFNCGQITITWLKGQIPTRHISHGMCYNLRMDKIENLKIRAKALRTIRAFFDARGFVEVETPVRIAAPAPEPHIDCPASGDCFLRASPEQTPRPLWQLSHL